MSSSKKIELLVHPSTEGFESKHFFQEGNGHEFVMDLVQKICYTVTDLNNEIPELDHPTPKTIIYVITLVDWITNAVRLLREAIPADSIKNFSYAKEPLVKQAKKYISAIRSFAVAHPLGTDRHKKYGFDGTTICVDIRPNQNSLWMMPDERRFYIALDGKRPYSNEVVCDYCFYVYAEGDNYQSFYSMECSFFDLYTVARLFLDKMSAIDQYLSKQKE